MSSKTFETENSDTPKLRSAQRGETENPVGARILSAAGRMSRREVAEAAEVSVSTLGDAITRGIAKADLAVALARALNVSVDWLLTGAGDPMSKPAKANTVVERGDDDLVDVQEIDLAYGLGGTFSGDMVEVETHRFPRAWLGRITSTPASLLTIARGRGDSMQPTVHDGDMVMIDRSQRIVREQDVIWALTVGEIAMIKRVRVRGDKVILLSDNDIVPPDEVHGDEVNIVGRVVFIGRRL